MKDTPLFGAAMDGSVVWGHRVSTNFLLKIKTLVRVMLLLLLVGVCLAVHAQTNEWVWMGGSSTVAKSWETTSYGTFQYGQQGVYGALGVPASGNVPGGRYSASNWTDSSGNLWLFGGEGFDSGDEVGILNDLWEFIPSTNQWTWVGGSNVSLCTVVMKHLVCTGQPGAYGTLGVPGVTNVPGGRAYASSSVDKNGNLWLFGGTGFDSNGAYGVFNDLWEFSPTTREWAWMGGSSMLACNVPSAQTYCGQPGVSGTLGVPGTTNVPGGRAGASSWTDNAGNVWLFGGLGYDSAGDFGYLNDLWEYSPSAGEWAWMGGKSTIPCTTVDGQSSCGQPGVYGTLGVAAATNFPGSRIDASNSTDGNGNLWLFGGDGNDSTASDWG